MDYHGSARNNMVDLRGGAPDVLAMPVLHDPDDPDPERRFKLAFECRGYENKSLAVAFSPDGLRWTESPRNPVGPMLELSGIIRFNGCYYVNGHGGFHFGTPRDLVTCASYDFEHWTEATVLGFQRDRLPLLDMAGVATGGNSGEQVHLGAGLWDRGNVILGVYDIWHGHPSGDRKLVAMDLGLVISHNAMHYHEPIPDFRLVPAPEEQGGDGALFPQEGMPPIIGGPALTHGQGMCNWGDETFLYYSVWTTGGVRLARWPRDRLGCFRAFEPEEAGPPPPRAGKTPSATASPVPYRSPVSRRGSTPTSTAWASTPRSRWRCWTNSSSRCPAGPARPASPCGSRVCGSRWSGRTGTPWTGSTGPSRLRVIFDGLRRHDGRLYALYVG